MTAFRFTLIVFLSGVLLGCGLSYVWHDDDRIEQEKQLARISKIVQNHYENQCRRKEGGVQIWMHPFFMGIPEN